MDTKLTQQNSPYCGIFNDSYPPVMDGVTLAVENYVHWLGRKGWNPCVVTPWNPQHCIDEAPVIRYLSIPLIGRKPYRYGYPKLDPFVWGRLRRTPMRIIHSHSPFSAGRLALYTARKQHVPLVGTFHSKYREDLERGFRSMPWVVDVIMKKILHFYNSCDEVWIPQAKVEETIREYGYRGKVHVVENGNDFADMPAEDIPVFKARCRKELGVPDGCPVLLFVGQHIWEKGIGLIAEALKIAAGRHGFRMFFVGTGYAADELKHKIEEEGLADIATLEGVVMERDRLRRYYGAADLFLFPSEYDNAPLVVREAAAMGTPAVMLRDSTAAEVIKDGNNGFLVSNSAEELADAIGLVWSDRDMVQKVGLQAKATIVRSWQDVLYEVANRYNALIDRYNG